MRASFIWAWCWLAAAPACGAAPLGGITRVDGPTIHGWACDPDTPGAPITVDVYANGIGTRGIEQGPVPSWARFKGMNQHPDHFAGTSLATGSAEAPQAACGTTPHGFTFTVPRAFRSALGPGTHELHLFLRRTVGEGENPAMPGSPIALRVTGTATATDDWFNGLRHGCTGWKDKVWPDRSPERQDPGPGYRFEPDATGCALAYPGGFDWRRDRFWVLETTNETKDFSPVYDTAQQSNDFQPNVASRKGGVPVWRLSLDKGRHGGYTVRSTLDKSRGRSPGTRLDSYSAAFIQTEVPKSTPELSSHALFLELWYRVRRAEGFAITAADAAAGLTHDPFAVLSGRQLLPARYRFTIGMFFDAPSGPPRRNVEVNVLKSSRTAGSPGKPARTDSFDLCTTATLVEALTPPTPCEMANRHGAFYADDIGLFDRRAASNPIVYYDLGTLHRIMGLPQPSGDDGTFQRVLLPLHALLRNAPWLDRPGLRAALPMKDGQADLSGFKLGALYIGSEIWGKARLSVEFERLQIFTFVAD